MNLNSLSLPVLCLTLAGCGGVHPSDDEYFATSPSTVGIQSPSVTVAGPSVAPSAQRLATITNDRNTIVNALDLKLDAAGNVTGIVYQTDNSGSVTQKEFTTAQIGSGYGVVLEEQSGIQAILLRGQIDAASGTGLAALRYISNGTTGAYAECPVRLNRSTNGIWMLTNAYTGQTVTTIQTVTWSLGITTFSGICKQ